MHTQFKDEYFHTVNNIFAVSTFMHKHMFLLLVLALGARHTFSQWHFSNCTKHN